MRDYSKWCIVDGDPNFGDFRRPKFTSFSLGQGVVGVGVGGGPGDGDSVVALYLVQEGIDTGDDLLVGNRFDGADGKQFGTVKTVRYKIVTRCEGRVERLAPSTDPVQRMVKGAEFPRVAGGSPSTDPVAS